MGAGLEAYVFGSVARGDVRPESDVDVVILDPAPPYLVELAIERAGLRAYSKEIVQATPSYVPGWTTGAPRRPGSPEGSAAPPWG